MSRLTSEVLVSKHGTVYKYNDWLILWLLLRQSQFFLTYTSSNGLLAEVNRQVYTFDMVIIGHAVQNCSSGLHTCTVHWHCG